MFTTTPEQNFTSGFVPSYWSRPSSAYGTPSNLATEAENRAPDPFVIPGNIDLSKIIAGTAEGVVDSLSDPRTQIAVLQAKIKNYEGMKRQIPVMAWWYDNEIAKMRAKITAARQHLALEKEGEDATRSWRNIGQTGSIVAIGVGVAAFLALLSVVTRGK